MTGFGVLKCSRLAIAAIIALILGRSAVGATCDRACLLQHATQVNHNMLAHTTGKIPLARAAEIRFGGLTTFGTAVIKECNRLGILIDLAHANMQTTQAALKVTTRPVIISHTGLDTQLGSNPSGADDAPKTH